MRSTTLQRITDKLLQNNHATTLEIVLRDSRDNGDSYETIAATLADMTGVDVSHMSVYRWFNDLDETVAV
jgi:hypothetical protein